MEPLHARSVPIRNGASLIASLSAHLKVFSSKFFPRYTTSAITLAQAACAHYTHIRN